MSDDESTLDEVLRKSEKTLESIPAQVVATECYDDFFDIYKNSSRGNGPLSIIAMHEPEDLALVDPYDVYLDRFMAANVLKFTGITFDKFLLLTKDRAESILKRCDKMASIEDNAVDSVVSGAGGKHRKPPKK